MVTFQNVHEIVHFVQPSIFPLITHASTTLLQALAILNETPEGFRILVDADGRLQGILDHRRLMAAILELSDLNARLSLVRFPSVAVISADGTAKDAIEVMQKTPDFVVPVCDAQNRVVNVITRQAFHQWLAADLPWDPYMDFLELQSAGRTQDAVFRPWGFYRVLLCNEFTQTKILSLDPGQEISLQKHFLREEYWTVVRGEGIFRLDDEIFPVSKGFSARIPRNAVHWIRNVSTRERLVILEVQTGEAFREDDIVRLADRYHRA